MTSPFRRTRIATAVGGMAVALGAGQAFGAAFALIEQNALGLGNAFAGSAAIAEDSSTIYFNPAGLARLNFTQVKVAAHLIVPSVKFTNQSSQAALGQPLGGDGGDAGSLAVVPNLYASMAINDQWHVGIGVNAPFGLKTEYDDGWLGRYQALKSEIKTINVNPAVSYKLNDAWWFGAGANYQQLNATLSNAVNYTGALALGYGAAALAGQIPATVIPSLIAATSGLDSKGTVTGDDYSWGWNAGVMYSLNEDTRVGLAYRSTIKYNVAGNVDFANPVVPTLAGPLAPLNPVVVGVSNAINSTALKNGGVTLDITMPDMASLSYYQRINDLYDVLADVTWTGWSNIRELRIVRTDGSVLSVLPENFRDTWRVSAGINYQYAEKIVLRAGVAFDQSPINDTDRGPRLPDNDRTWLTVGGRFKLSPQSNIDVGAAYIFVKDSSINNAGNPANIPANGLINGTYKNNVVIVSGQINYRFR